MLLDDTDEDSKLLKMEFLQPGCRTSGNCSECWYYLSQCQTFQWLKMDESYLWQECNTFESLRLEYGHNGLDNGVMVIIQ